VDLGAIIPQGAECAEDQQGNDQGEQGETEAHDLQRSSLSGYVYVELREITTNGEKGRLLKIKFHCLCGGREWAELPALYKIKKSLKMYRTVLSLKLIIVMVSG